jgi:hypothetical protein
MHVHRTCLLITAILVAACCSVYAADRPVGITVTGYAEVKAKPDVAYVSLGVSTENKDAGRAAQENAGRTDAVIAALAKSGVAKPDIETQHYSVQPNYDYKKSPATLVGYTVSNIVRVTVRDLTKVGTTIDAALAAGANNVQGVQFSLEKSEQVKQQALVEAVKNAEAKAKLIADAIGRRLGHVVSVAESGASIPRPLEFGVMAKYAEAAPPTPIIPGEIETSASVTVVYAIL